jgi:uncharacterized membrane protein
MSEFSKLEEDDPTTLPDPNMRYFVLHFATKDGAKDALVKFKSWAQEEAYTIEYAAVLYKTTNGKVKADTYNFVDNSKKLLSDAREGAVEGYVSKKFSLLGKVLTSLV